MKKKQTKMPVPKERPAFPFLKRKNHKGDLILNRKMKKQDRFFSHGEIPASVFFGESVSVTATEQESEPNQLFATAACLMDGDTGRVLFGKRETDPMAMASTTKIMTCILALENGQEQTVATASAKAAAAPKVHLGVREGRTVSAWRSSVFPDAGIA